MMKATFAKLKRGDRFLYRGKPWVVSGVSDDFNLHHVFGEAGTTGRVVWAIEEEFISDPEARGFPDPWVVTDARSMEAAS